MQALRKIKELFARFERTKQFSPSDQHYLVSQVRQVLEHKRLKQKYNIVNFYCNLTLHTKLSRSIECFKMIEEVGNLLLRNIDNNSNNSKEKERELHNAFISTASEIFNIDTLREQLISLFNEIGVSDFLFNDDN
jgi:hypothetical protein